MRATSGELHFRFFPRCLKLAIWICFSSFCARSSRSALFMRTHKEAVVYVCARLCVLVVLCLDVRRDVSAFTRYDFPPNSLFFPTAKWELNWRPDRFCALALDNDESAFNTDFCLSLI